jgi:hypothetical protein
MKEIFCLEPQKISALKTMNIPDKELDGLDSIEVQEVINQKYLEWMSNYIDFNWEVIEEESM